MFRRATNKIRVRESAFKSGENFFCGRDSEIPSISRVSRRRHMASIKRIARREVSGISLKKKRNKEGIGRKKRRIKKRGASVQIYVPNAWEFMDR